MGGEYLICDQCGELRHISEFVETIEEYLCEYCASGLPDDDHEYDDWDDLMWPPIDTAAETR